MFRGTSLRTDGLSQNLLVMERAYLLGIGLGLPVGYLRVSPVVRKVVRKVPGSLTTETSQEHAQHHPVTPGSGNRWIAEPHSAQHTGVVRLP